MKHAIILLLIISFATIAFFVNRSRNTSIRSVHCVKTIKKTPSTLPKTINRAKMRKNILSTSYLEKYIETIIKNGSNQHLTSKHKDMPSGIASDIIAPKIAAYVVTLGGHRPTHPEWVKAGSVYFTSDCGSCHGQDGKGGVGAFPNLTLHTLLGIQKRVDLAAN